MHVIPWDIPIEGYFFNFTLCIWQKTQKCGKAYIMSTTPSYTLERYWSRWQHTQHKLFTENILMPQRFGLKGATFMESLKTWSIPHSNIYQVKEILRRTQAITECTTIQYTVGRGGPPKRCRYKDRDWTWTTKWQIPARTT